MKSRIILFVLIGLFVSGCVQNFVLEGQKIPEDYVGRIQPGITKRSEVLQWFGPPEQHKDPNTVKKLLQQVDAEGEFIKVDHPAFKDAFVYEFSYGRTEVFSIILFTYLIDDHKKDLLIVFFNPDDTVKYFAHRKGT
ncbi:MAG TPA: hypothetical protein VJL89_12250 [Thermodesulfovibrionia bacterium]|nr:hypothetical protein [Thermodesulfovibrionia bacterium]